MSTKDPLAAYRKGPAVSPTEKDQALVLPDDGEYRAFHAADRDQASLKVYTNGPAWVHPRYSYLQYVAEDAGRGRRLNIIYGFMVIEVKGRNLQPVAQAISAGNCVFIQQFDSNRWKKPSDTSAAFIESIEFHHGAEKRSDMLGNHKKAEHEEV